VAAFFPVSTINYNICRPSSRVIYDDRKIKLADRFCISSRRDAACGRANDRRSGKYCGVRFVVFPVMYIGSCMHIYFIHEIHIFRSILRYPRGITHREKLHDVI
jgi:hypothetical protein